VVVDYSRLSEKDRGDIAKTLYAYVAATPGFETWELKDVDQYLHEKLKGRPEGVTDQQRIELEKFIKAATLQFTRKSPILSKPRRKADGSVRPAPVEDEDADDDDDDEDDEEEEEKTADAEEVPPLIPPSEEDAEFVDPTDSGPVHISPARSHPAPPISPDAPAPSGAGLTAEAREGGGVARSAVVALPVAPAPSTPTVVAAAYQTPPTPTTTAADDGYWNELLTPPTPLRPPKPTEAPTAALSTTSEPSGRPSSEDLIDDDLLLQLEGLLSTNQNYSIGELATQLEVPQKRVLQLLYQSASRQAFGMRRASSSAIESTPSNGHSKGESSLKLEVVMKNPSASTALFLAARDYQRERNEQLRLRMTQRLLDSMGELLRPKS
jgi:hypothetical protein